MALTSGEKIIIALQCDASRPSGSKEFDTDFIASCVASDELWAIANRYSAIGLNEPFPAEVEEVADILDMWRDITRSYSNIGVVGQTLVNTSVGAHAVVFDGFDANNGNQYHISKRLIEDLELWPEFGPRALNSHSNNIAFHRAKLAVYRTIRKARSATHSLALTEQEIIRICS